MIQAIYKDFFMMEEISETLLKWNKYMKAPLSHKHILLVKKIIVHWNML